MSGKLRQRLEGKALTEAVAKSGVEAINSDEEQNGLLDENQQEAFISQMTILVTQYISRWKSFFAWTSLLIVYVRILNLLGLVPFTRSFLMGIEFKSFFLNLALSPIALSQSLFHVWYLCVLLTLVDFCGILWLTSHSIRSSNCNRGLTRGFAVVSFVAHSIVAISSHSTILGRHFVVSVSVPLLCIAAETLNSSQLAATQGLDKLVKFKYAHKKA